MSTQGPIFTFLPIATKSGDSTTTDRCTRDALSDFGQISKFGKRDDGSPTDEIIEERYEGRRERANHTGACLSVKRELCFVSSRLK